MSMSRNALMTAWRSETNHPIIGIAAVRPSLGGPSGLSRTEKQKEPFEEPSA
jgi:hypothetical protein